MKITYKNKERKATIWDVKSDLTGERTWCVKIFGSKGIDLATNCKFKAIEFATAQK